MGRGSRHSLGGRAGSTGPKRVRIGLTCPVTDSPGRPEHNGPPHSLIGDDADDWGPWVLDHGLPKLPDELGEDETVPVAYWSGPFIGAVMFRSWWPSAGDDDDDGGDECPDVDDTVQLYSPNITWVGAVSV